MIKKYLHKRIKNSINRNKLKKINKKKENKNK